MKCRAICDACGMEKACLTLVDRKLCFECSMHPSLRGAYTPLPTYDLQQTEAVRKQRPS